MHLCDGELTEIKALGTQYVLQMNIKNLVIVIRAAIHNDCLKYKILRF